MLVQCLPITKQLTAAARQCWTTYHSVLESAVRFARVPLGTHWTFVILLFYYQITR